MGRRKIEIKAIKDDRNRSVTFLKRKGGLFKKAHELSVLCSVDVAVIIFGHNKKLYEFSSGDINETIGRYQYYGGAHEHKGPEDFMGKKDAGSDDDDEDVEDLRPGTGSPPQGPSMAQHLHTQHQFGHLGSASPPMPNGAFQHRGPSPQPPQNISRPGSRAHVRGPSSHLVPPQHPQHLQVSGPPPPQQQPSYAYVPNPPIFNPQTAAGVQMRAPPPGQLHPSQYQQFAQPGQPHPGQHPGQHPQQHPGQHPGQQHPSQHPGQHPPQHPQVQQLYAQEQQRRQGSAPPQFSQQPPPPPQQDPRQAPQPQPSPQPPPAQFSSPPIPQPKPLPSAAKAHSIFTPIDDSRSLLAQHWGSSRDEIPKSDPIVKIESERSQSIDVGSINRHITNGFTAPPHINTSHGPGPSHHPQRTASTPVIPSIHAHPPSRTNSLQTKPRGPKLKVQIPNEDSEDEGVTAGSSPQATAAATRTPIGREHSGVVLPPPSPSAGALLSAGASGPPNPFARPPPPGAVNGNYNRSDMETPISALPSRFVSDQLLPSPSSFYADWFQSGSATRDNNMLPSPLAFPTPIVMRGPSFGDEDERKRKLEESGGGTPEKRIKT